MGCSSSLAEKQVESKKNGKSVENGRENFSEDRNKKQVLEDNNNRLAKQKTLAITDLVEDERRKEQIYTLEENSTTKREESSRISQTMSMKVELPPTRDISANDNSTHTQISMGSRGHNDANNKASDRRMNPAGGSTEEDQFDMSSEPLSRIDMVKNRSHATKETLDFVYKTSTRIAPPVETNSFVPGSSSSYQQVIPSGNRMTNRRGSGVPPPPRELKSSDFLARRAAGAKITMEEEMQEENEQ